MPERRRRTEPSTSTLAISHQRNWVNSLLQKNQATSSFKSLSLPKAVVTSEHTELCGHHTFDVKAKTSRADPTDSKISGTTRAGTYEALDKDVSEMSFITTTTIGRSLRSACQQIVKRLEVIANHRFVKSEAFKRETRRVGMIQRQEAAAAGRRDKACAAKVIQIVNRRVLDGDVQVLKR